MTAANLIPYGIVPRAAVAASFAPTRAAMVTEMTAAVRLNAWARVSKSIDQGRRPGDGVVVIEYLTPMCASPREMSGPRAAATVQRRLHRATRSESPGNGGHGWPGRPSRQGEHLACQDFALYLVGAAVDHGAAGADQRRQRVECLAAEFLVAGDCALLLAGLDQQGADAVIGFAGPDFEQRDRCRQWLAGFDDVRESGVGRRQIGHVQAQRGVALHEYRVGKQPARLRQALELAQRVLRLFRAAEKDALEAEQCLGDAPARME